MMQPGTLIVSFTTAGEGRLQAQIGFQPEGQTEVYPLGDTQEIDEGKSFQVAPVCIEAEVVTQVEGTSHTAMPKIAGKPGAHQQGPPAKPGVPPRK
jgi:hypothetical protein